MLPVNEAKDLAVILAAFTGMGLGIYNFLREKKKDKVRLKVIPKTVVQRSEGINGGLSLSSTTEFDPKQNAGLFGIEIINMSDFSIVVNQVGFIKRGSDRRLSIIKPILDDSGEWPRKLEPRESVSAYGLVPELIKSNALHLVTKAYVATACGEVRTGKNKALSELIAWGKVLHNN